MRVAQAAVVDYSAHVVGATALGVNLQCAAGSVDWIVPWIVQWGVDPALVEDAKVQVLRLRAVKVREVGVGVEAGAVQEQCARARLSHILGVSAEQPIVQRVLRWQQVLRDTPVAHVRLYWIMASFMNTNLRATHQRPWDGSISGWIRVLLIGFSLAGRGHCVNCFAMFES